MGWLFYTDGRVQTYADEKAEIARLCTFEGDRRKTELVKACKVGSTWYAAAKVTSIDGSPVEDTTYLTDADGSITFGLSSSPDTMTAAGATRIWRKALARTSRVPPPWLIERLSDLKDEGSYAQDWRQRCRDWASIPDYEEGDKIRLAAPPVTLTDGSTCQIVTATYYKRGRQNAAATASRKPVARAPVEGLACGSELLSSAKGDASPVLAEFLAGRDA